MGNWIILSIFIKKQKYVLAYWSKSYNLKIVLKWHQNEISQHFFEIFRNFGTFAIKFLTTIIKTIYLFNKKLYFAYELFS